jgi:hypothetical protein
VNLATLRVYNYICLSRVIMHFQLVVLDQF